MSDHLADLIADPTKHQRATRSRGGVTIRFGTNEVHRHGWDGLYPVNIVRVDVMADGASERVIATCRVPTTVERRTREAGKGWRSGAQRSWVELRTPTDRGVTP